MEGDYLDSFPSAHAEAQDVGGDHLNPGLRAALKQGGVVAPQPRIVDQHIDAGLWPALADDPRQCYHFRLLQQQHRLHGVNEYVLGIFEGSNCWMKRKFM